MCKPVPKGTKSGFLIGTKKLLRTKILIKPQTEAYFQMIPKMDKKMKKNFTSPSLNSFMSKSTEIPLPREVEMVLREIDQKWEFMTNPAFNPVTLALELLDDNARTRDLTMFNSFLERLESAMDLVVNENYEAFKNSIETFEVVTQKLYDCQDRIMQFRQILENCKNMLLMKRSDLVDLWTKSVQLKEMLRIIEKIDEVSKFPSVVHEQIQKRMYLSSIQTIEGGLKILQSDKIAKVGAVSDITTQLTAAKQSLHSKIIEEITLYLYMRHDKCDSDIFGDLYSEDDRLDYLNSVIEQLNLNNSESPMDKRFPRVHSTAKSRQSPFKPNSGSDPSFMTFNETLIMEDGEEYNPDEDLLQFIQTMISALFSLDKVDDLVLTLKSNMPSELYEIVEEQTEKINEKRNDLIMSFNLEELSVNHLTALRNQYKKQLMQELLVNIYSKFFWILNMHKHINDSILKIKNIREQEAVEGNVSPGNSNNTISSSDIDI